jgi:hypothetical protein
MNSIPGLSPVAASLPWITTGQMVEVDRAMIEDVRILADIGVPLQLYRRPPLALDVPDLFAEADLIRVW